MKVVTTISLIIFIEFLLLLLLFFISKARRFRYISVSMPFWITATAWPMLDLMALQNHGFFLLQLERILVYSLPPAIVLAASGKDPGERFWKKVTWAILTLSLTLGIIGLCSGLQFASSTTSNFFFTVSFFIFFTGLAVFVIRNFFIAKSLCIRTERRRLTLSTSLLIIASAFSFVLILLKESHSTELLSSLVLLPAFGALLLGLPEQGTRAISVSRSGRQDILDKIGVMIFIIDAEGGMLFANRAASGRLRLRGPVLGNISFNDLIFGDFQFSGKEEYRRNLSLFATDGEKLYVEASFIPVGSAPVQAYLVVCTDLKEIAGAIESGILLERLRRWNADKFMSGNRDGRERDSFLSIIENIDNGVVVINDDLNLLYCNRAYEEISGILREDYLGYPFHRLPALSRSRLIEESRYFEQEEISFKNIKTGRKFDILLFLAPVKIATSEQLGMILTTTNISRQKEEARKKTEFVSYVSHEINSPLSTIQGFASTLKEIDSLSEEDRNNYLTIIEQEAARLSRIIEELLSLSRLESDGFSLEKQRFSLTDLIKEVIVNFSIQAEQKRISIQFKERKEIPCIHADRDRIKQILVNIVANAIKFSPQGKTIEISIKYGREIRKFRIDIQDEGSGFAKGEEELIFNKFFRSHLIKDSVKGTGLGLSIAMDIAKKHNGTITASNRKDKGALVSLFLPEH